MLFIRNIAMYTTDSAYNPKIMATYRKTPSSKFYMMDFIFEGQRVYKSTQMRTKQLADRVERNHRAALEEGRAQLGESKKTVFFGTAAKDWLDLRKAKATAGAIAANTVRIDEANLIPILATFRDCIITDITSRDVAAYQTGRLKSMAPKTVNLELATLSVILKRHGCWEKISLDVGMSKVPDSIGRVVSADEQAVLFASCEMSRSRQLFTIVMLAFQTGVRFGPLKLLRWRHVDFANRCIQWGKDKTPAGSGRTVPLNTRALACLEKWAAQFPNRKPTDFVFFSERCGNSGHQFGTLAPIYYDCDPTTPIGSIKTAWIEAKKRAGIKCRFHDIRHTAVTAMVNGGVPLPKIAKVVGWSASQTVRMSLIYGHFNLEDLRDAMETLDATATPMPAPTEGRPN